MFVFAIKTASTPNLEDKKASVENLTEWARVQSTFLEYHFKFRQFSIWTFKNYLT